MWRKIIRTIKHHHKFLLTSHVNPDCDALGSELALGEHLETLGKDVTIINSDATNRTYRFLDPANKIKRYSGTKHASKIKKAEVIMVLDASGGWSRLGPVGQALSQSKAVKICIDHHPDHEDFVDLAVIDPDAAATGELIFYLIKTMNGSLSKNMAIALYAALLTDTGSFRFPKTSPQTHHIAAELLSRGANPLEIHSRLYEQNSLNLVRIKGHIMDTVKTADGGQIAYYSLTQNTLRSYGVKSSELEGVPSLGQQIEGVRISVFCMETLQGQVKVSLRSDGSVPINQIALEYGGGGHPSAAGAIISGQLEPIMAELVKKTTALLQVAPSSHQI